MLDRDVNTLEEGCKNIPEIFNMILIFITKSERCLHHLLGGVAAAAARKRQAELQAAVVATETLKAVPIGYKGRKAGRKAW